MARITPILIEEIRKLVAADPTMTQKDIRDRFGLAQSCLSKRLITAGIMLRNDHRLVPDDDVLRAELPYLTARAGAERYGISRSGVAKHAARLGIVMKPAGNSTRRPPAEARAKSPLPVTARPKPNVDLIGLLSDIEVLLAEETDACLEAGSVPSRPQSILEDQDDRRHYAGRLVRMADLARRVRKLKAVA